ncbi:Ser/Thr protein kinase RdoA (MazF antagonist) [Kushneria sinocarnis]|uniref:Stress response kinase A n=1 Tax=Kushneria sinocarnis TaxID=595502 RepID=A0A420WZ35_9GAMM|nr:serine/threonine protein kinase [Kushneria sinocarnis]RKR06430.1 Ser/Thr protein kinase RdoA (MazF antagonist) [Kushneria sinocarnis]
MARSAQTHPFEALKPERIVAAIESQGLRVEGEPFALNSYENRVFDWRDDEGRRFIAKFYRPDRLENSAILEEHAFLDELEEAGVRIGPVWHNEQGETLHEYEGYRFALFHAIPGQPPELDNPAHLFALGETIGQVHAVARRRSFRHRATLSPGTVAAQSCNRVLERGWLTTRQRSAYERITGELLNHLPDDAWPVSSLQRVHGDCHPGNILGRDEHFALVDFDDCTMAPAVQDLWMLISANEPMEWQQQVSELIEGYEQYCDFERRQLGWIEQLRTVRLLRYSAWLIERWEDPAFPRAFPWLTEEHYWDQHIRTLEQQRVALEQPNWLA